MQAVLGSSWINHPLESLSICRLYSYHSWAWWIGAQKNTAASVVMVWKQSTIWAPFQTGRAGKLLHTLPSQSSFFPPLSCKTSFPVPGILSHFSPFCSQVPEKEGSEKGRYANSWQHSTFFLIIRNEENPNHLADFHILVSSNKLA